MKYSTLAILLALLVLPAGVASAHGGGNEISKRVGDHLIELSLETLEPTAGVAERLNFDFWSATSSENMEGRYDRVWVRVMKGDDLLFSTWLYKPEGLLSGFTYTFPFAGVYEVTARFMGPDLSIETDFTLTVAPGEGEASSGIPLGLVTLFSGIAFLAGALIAKRYAAPAAA